MRDEQDKPLTSADPTSTPLPRIRRLPPVDCATPEPRYYPSHDRQYPDWLVQPDRQAEDDGPSVHPVYLDHDDPDGLNLARGISWVLLMAVVGLVLVGVWAACRN